MANLDGTQQPSSPQSACAATAVSTHMLSLLAALDPHGTSMKARLNFCNKRADRWMLCVLGAGVREGVCLAHQRSREIFLGRSFARAGVLTGSSVLEMAQQNVKPLARSACMFYNLNTLCAYFAVSYSPVESRGHCMD